jgi:transcriptional regulator with XRE-family HTH domain
MTLGDNIRRLREGLGLSQSALAREADCRHHLPPRTRQAVTPSTTGDPGESVRREYGGVDDRDRAVRRETPERAAAVE